MGNVSATRDPVPRLARGLERWGIRVRRVVLELGSKQLVELPHDGVIAGLHELAQQLAEIGVDAADGYERDISCQLTAYGAEELLLGTAPVKFYRTKDEDPKEAGDTPASRQVAQLLRHNEQLQERLLALTEQTSQGLSRALEAQGRVLDALGKRLSDAEKLLGETQGREQEAQSVAREALGLVETAFNQTPAGGFKATLEKVGGLIELVGKGKELLEAQKLLDSGKANGTASSSSPAAASDGGGN